MRWTQNLKAEFTRRFAPTIEFAGTTGREFIAVRSRTRKRILVGRGRCIHVAIDARKIPNEARTAHAKLQARKLSPWPSYGWTSIPQGDLEALWIWDDLSSEAGSGEMEYLPESLFVETGMTDGAEVIALREGHEARLWRQGVLHASRWFPLEPGDAEWIEFLRGAGCAPEPRPAIAKPAYRDTPWHFGAHRGTETHSLARRALLAGPAMAILPLFVAAFFAGEWAAFALRTANVEGELAELRDLARPILEARDRHDAALESIDEHRWTRRPMATHGELLAKVTELLSSRRLKLLGWASEDRDTVTVTASNPGQDLAGLIEAIEADPRIVVEQTESSLAGRGVAIKLSVRTARETSEERQ